VADIPLPGMQYLDILGVGEDVVQVKVFANYLVNVGYGVEVTREI